MPQVDGVVHGRVTVDRRSRDHAAGSQGAPGLCQGPHSIGPVRQVVEVAQEEDRVLARVRDGQWACVAEPRAHPGQSRGTLDVARNGIQQFDRVAVGAQPLGVHAGAAARVQHARRHAGDAVRLWGRACSGSASDSCGAYDR
ncbi:hypothetical protein GCM10009734_35790 [Nonomuraea bangladeshensis]